MFSDNDLKGEAIFRRATRRWRKPERKIASLLPGLKPVDGTAARTNGSGRPL